MKKHLVKSMLALALVSMSAGFVSNALAASSDVKEFNTGYFVPDEASTYDYPYYRWAGDDWGWTHTAISEAVVTEATLYISAWDVDADDSYSPEVDMIFAYDTDTSAYIQLGSLAGNGDAWGYTTFVLPTVLYNEISGGLQVWMNIDVNSDGWAVTLAKSVLTVNGGYVPPPAPGAVPEPATALLFGCGIIGLAAAGRRKLK